MGTKIFIKAWNQYSKQLFNLSKSKSINSFEKIRKFNIVSNFGDPKFRWLPSKKQKNSNINMGERRNGLNCPQKCFTTVTHVIFDLDGTLLDTEAIYEEIMKTIARSFGKELPFELRMKILGTTEQNSAALLINGLNLPISQEEYLELYHKMCKEKLSGTNLMKGAERLLNHLHANCIPFSLATSSSSEMVQLKTARHMKLFKLFNHLVCGSSDPEVKNGKPAPDIFLVAASRFADKPQPAKCLVFEDAPNGVEGARCAGMQVVMVPAPATPKEMCKKATIVLKSLEEFQPELFGLPPFPQCTC